MGPRPQRRHLLTYASIHFRRHMPDSSTLGSRGFASRVGLGQVPCVGQRRRVVVQCRRLARRGPPATAVAAGPARLAASPAEERPRLGSGRRWSGRWPQRDEAVSAATAAVQHTAAILGSTDGVAVGANCGRRGDAEKR